MRNVLRVTLVLLLMCAMGFMAVFPLVLCASDHSKDNWEFLLFYPLYIVLGVALLVTVDE